MKDTRQELLTKSIWELMIKLSIPAIIGMVVIGLYTFMDGIFVGQLIGSKAMAAVSIAYPITFLNNGIATLVGIGSASVLSRAIGESDKKTVDKIMGNLIGLVLILSSIIMIFGIIFARELLQISGATGEILELSTNYLRIIFMGSIFVNFTQSANMVMRGEGLMKKAMLIMGFGAILNIILDPIMISVFKDRGIEGVAIATIIAQITQAIITLYYFIRKSNRVKIHKIRIEKKISENVIKVGVSAMLMQVLSMVQQTLLFRMAFKYGGDSNAIIMSAALRLQAFSFIPLWGMAQGLQPVVGMNYGAKLFDRVKKATNLFILGATVLGMCFWIPMELFPKTMLGLFIKDSNLVLSGANNFRIFYSIFFFYGAMIMMITFFQAIGNGKVAGKMVFLRQVIVFIPAMILMPKIFGLPAVWYTQPIVDLFVIILGALFLRKEYLGMDKNKKSGLKIA